MYVSRAYIPSVMEGDVVTNSVGIVELKSAIE